MRLVGHVIAVASDPNSFFPWLRAKLNEMGSTMQLALTVGVGGFLLFVLMFRRTIGKFLVALALSATAIWAIDLGGAQSVASLFSHEAPAPAVTNQIIAPAQTPPTP